MTLRVACALNGVFEEFHVIDTLLLFAPLASLVWDGTSLLLKVFLAPYSAARGTAIRT